MGWDGVSFVLCCARWSLDGMIGRGGRDFLDGGLDLALGTVAVGSAVAGGAVDLQMVLDGGFGSTELSRAC